MSFMRRRVGFRAWVLWMIALIGILIYVVAQMVPGFDLGMWRWVLLGMGLLAGVGAAIASSGGFGSPHYRKVRFFNTTDSKVSSVKIKRNPPQTPITPPNIANVAAGASVFLDASYDEPFYTNATKLDVIITAVNPADPMGPNLVAEFWIEVPPGAGLIDELVIIIGGQNGAYSGAAWAMYALDDSEPLQPTGPVAIDLQPE